MGTGRAFAAVGMTILLAIVALPVRGTPEPPTVWPTATLPYDVAPWFLGDSWTYRIRIEAADPSGLTTRAFLNLTHTVSRVQVVNALGRTYTAYNSTVSGTMRAMGDFPPGRYDVSDNTVTGWILTDRSNLARIGENQTIDARGSFTVLFVSFPIWMNTTTTTLHGPAMEDYDAPLELGDTWSLRGVSNTTGLLEVFTDVGAFGGPQWMNQTVMNETSADLRSWFNATESVTVPAGTFLDAARVHVAGPGQTLDWWYHPDVRSFVRMDSHSVNGPNDYRHVWVNLSAYSPTPSPWPGSVSVVPQKVNPGGWATATGLANPNEDIVVTVPATGATYDVRAGATGDWSLPFRAPTVDDDTPANADVGSHGIVVEPSLSPAGWNVTTIQLLLPDLYTDAAELVLSNPTPAVGVPVDVNATLRASPTVAVSSSFDVTFSIDGSEVYRATGSNLSAGAAVGFGISWTPSAGAHTIAFTVDANDDVREVDEGNNTAFLTVLVRDADLVPWNITLESETTSTYLDPAATGFVSAPVQGRLGGVLNVSSDVANVGIADAPSGFMVRLVQTQGLWGPPTGAPVGEVVVSVVVPAGGMVDGVDATWPIPSAPGVYHLNLTVDATDAVIEDSESNNTFAIVVNVSGPDYTVASLTAPPKVTAGASLSIEAVVRNDGQLGGDRDVLVALFDGPALLTTQVVAPLSPSATSLVTFPWTAPGTATVVTFRVVVDSDGRLEEMSEANNEASAAIEVRLAPITNLEVVGLNVTWNGTRYVTSAATFGLDALDRSDEGLTTYYRIDGAGPVTYVGAFSLATEGPHSIEYWSEDAIGGVEIHHAFAVTVDDSPPTSDAQAAQPVGDRRTVTITADDGGVGVDRIEYRVDGGLWATYEGPFDVVGLGDHTVTYRAVDRLGHQGPDRILNVTVSETAPGAVTNWKPLLAIAFAAVLILLGLYMGRRQSGWSLASPRAVGLAFGGAELATGALSLVSSALAVPPYGLGLVVDLAILVAGLLAILVLPRRASPPEDMEEPKDPPGTDK